MPPIAQMSRSVWWAFAAAGAAALVAAALVAPSLVTPSLGTAAWQTLAGILLFVAAFRAPGGVARAVPFLGAAGTGVVLGGAGLLAPTLARAFHVPDGGLFTVAWLGLAVGIAVSTLPAFGLGASAFAPAGALAATGAISILAAVRLRVLPDEAPPTLSRREARRQQRSGPRP